MPGAVPYPGEGTVRCLGLTASGSRCPENEIEGLEFCLHHMPDDLLDEAEEITGVKRCRDLFGTQFACHYTAIGGSDPPVCKIHGGKDTTIAAGSAKRVIEGRVADVASRLAAGDGSVVRLLEPRPIGNPLEELLEVAAVMREWEQLTRRVLTTMNQNHWRYTNGKMGEQTRAEILLWERGIVQYANVLIQIAKLNIAKQLVGIRRETLDTLVRITNEALQQSGCDLDGQARARDYLRSHLKVIDGGLG
jgi:hypothetical protein